MGAQATMSAQTSVPGSHTIPPPRSRTKAVLLGSIAVMGSRAVGILTYLLTTSLLTRRLSKEEYGLWAVVWTFTAFATGFDFGLSQGLKNKLASLSADASGRTAVEQREYFLSVCYALGLTGLVGVAVTLVATPFVPWDSLLNISDPRLTATIVPILMVVISILLLAVPLSLSGSGFFAYQEAHWASLLNAGQSVLMLASLAIALQMFLFSGVLISYYATYGIVALVTFALFLWRRRWMPVRIPLGRLYARIRPLARVSFQFWILGVAALVISSTDTILASRVSGLAEAGNFSLIQRLFFLLLTVHMSILGPLGPAYTQAAQLGNWEWLRKALTSSVYGMGAFIVLGGGLIVLLHPWILRLWTGRPIQDFSLVLAMAFWALIYSWVNSYSVVLNSLGEIKLQSILLVVAALVNIPLSLFLGNRFGVVGITVASIICYMPLAVTNYLQVRYIINRQRLRV